MSRKLITIFFICIFSFVSLGLSPSKFPCACCIPGNNPLGSSLSITFGERTQGKCCHDRSKVGDGAPRCCLNRSMEDEKPFLAQSERNISSPNFSGFTLPHLPNSLDWENQTGNLNYFPPQLSRNIYLQNLAFRC